MNTRKRTHLLSTACLVTWLGAGCSSDPAAGTTTPGQTTTPTSTAGTPASTAGAPAKPTTTGTAGSPASSAAAGSAAPTGVTTPTTGAAGGGATAPAGTAGAPATVPLAGSAATAGAGVTATAGSGAATDPNARPDPRGKCTIKSGYPDDNACLLPPAPEEGMQIHVGPKSYDDPNEIAKFIMKPGEESSECWTFHTPNDSDVYYQTFELSGRSGTHHIINTMYNVEMQDGGFGACADPGTGTNGNIIDNLPGASKAYMPRGTVAPENKNVGRKIPPHVASQADMHYYNFTDHDIIREFWMNIFFAKKEDITQEAAQIRGMGGLSWSTGAPIPPKTDMTYSYESDPIVGNGRILSLLGHYHSHGKHFTASIRRAGTNKVEKVFEMYDYLDPATFEYDSVNKNPDFSDAAAGAVSGILELKAGDVLMWDCHIVNDSDVGLTYTNEVKTGEMCNLWGSTLGINPINALRL